MSSQASLTAAVVSASVAVLLAILAQVSTWTLEHRHRVYERRRAALLDVQDAAVRVRSTLRTAAADLLREPDVLVPGRDLVPAEDPRLRAERDDAAAVLELRLARVESEPVRAAVRRWHERAQFSFLGDDEVTVNETEAAWNAMNQLIGRELTVPGWWRRRRR